MFNKRLESLVDELNSKYNGSIFAYCNTFGVFIDILNNAKTYGKKHGNLLSQKYILALLPSRGSNYDNIFFLLELRHSHGVSFL